MNKRIWILLLICIVFASIVSAYSYVSPDKSSSDQNITLNITQDNIQDNKSQERGQNSLLKTKKDNNVIITLKGPDTPQKRGTDVSVYYTIVNNGKNTVYNVEVTSLDFAEYDGFTKKIGTLKPGERKKFTYQMYILTDEELGEMFGKGTTLDNPWETGGVDLSFKDDKGVLHSTSSNMVKIKLLN